MANLTDRASSSLLEYVNVTAESNKTAEQSNKVGILLINAVFNSLETFGNNVITNLTFKSNETFEVNTTLIRTFTHVPKYDLPLMVIICIVLSVLILSTILGNVFVIAAIILERSLQGVSNYLILSLAVTDLLVAIFVMPLSLVNEVSVFWYLGNTLCDFWICVDVLCCTASILHLVAISLDRFWGVSNIDYIRRRCAKQIVLMVIIVWIVAVCISIPPLFGWKDAANDPELKGMCVISQDLGYTVFSTVGAFYFPLVLMVILNCKIYIAARSRIRRKNFGRNKAITSTYATTDLKTRTSSCSDDDGYTMCNNSVAVTCAYNEECISEGETESPLNNSNSNGGYVSVPNGFTKPSGIYYTKINCDHPKCDVLENNKISDKRNSLVVANNGTFTKCVDNNNHKNELIKRKKKRRDADKKRKDKMEMKRERKAAKVLGIITGAFIACWLPFFLVAVIVPFCGQLCSSIPPAVFSFCLWLGYLNSTLNPILYTIFNPSFRKAFHKIIYGKYRLRSW